ncbi:hypothetical protein FQN55_008832 [Onygenales sp. PD_40]|nr:hypothetical protein FQN55_008832 [Onygenales sp. PD_40]KAK2778019.1 hypothetical protein FQN52_002924 [Onygenales sp. PD_12]KAK2781918.1 hypothetical protein FQN53_000261 [Emmonsiellopsis sp. PD_33]KAK2794864.1 hypothetical protein FQN51_000607 [Onygenales sp. PD_10]
MDFEQHELYPPKRVPAELDLERESKFSLSPSESPGTASSSQPLIGNEKGDASSSDTPHTPPLGYRLSRYYVRTIIGIVTPLLVGSYYLAIYKLFLKRKPDAVKYGTEDEIMIFYSWFLIGVFGLGLSKYGLSGVEVAMLQEPDWQASNTMVLMMHSGATWSSPAGWLAFLGRFIVGKERLTERLWHILATISFLGTIALPLSGMSIELANGWVGVPTPPVVSGRTWAKFHTRETDQTYDRAYNSLLLTTPVTVPGIGIIYTPPYVDRKKFKSFAALPNSLVDSGIPELFLAPQATFPINGEVWGVRLSYNCSIVKSVSELTMLNRSYLWEEMVTNQTAHGFQGEPDNKSRNIWGSMLIGSSIRSNRENYNSYDGLEPNSFDEKDLEKSDLLELVLWQIRRPAVYEGDEIIQFDEAVDPTIAGMIQPFTLAANGTVLVDPATIPLAKYPDGMAVQIPGPIGVRCRCVSALGTAELDADKSTFTKFQQSPSPPWNESMVEATTPRFGFNVRKMLSRHYIDFFPASRSAPPIALSNSLMYTKFIQPNDLLEAAMRAHAMDALQLMYDGIYSTEPEYSFTNENLTSSIPGKIIELGSFNPLIPGALFAIWAFSSAFLGCVYGFRRRWSEMLDGYSLFRFGAHLSHRIRHQPDFSTIHEFQKCSKLKELPGLVGDACPEMEVGQITLVSSQNVARKNKLYR